MDLKKESSEQDSPWVDFQRTNLATTVLDVALQDEWRNEAVEDPAYSQVGTCT